MLLKKIANAQVIKTIQQRAFHRSIVSLGHAAAVKHDEHKADGHHDEHHHHEHYTDNDGEAFGIHKGEQYKREGWELPFFAIFIGSLGLLIGSLAIKPNYDVHEWAQEELLRRQATLTEVQQAEKGNKTAVYHHLAFGRLMAELKKM